MKPAQANGEVKRRRTKEKLELLRGHGEHKLVGGDADGRLVLLQDVEGDVGEHSRCEQLPESLLQVTTKGRRDKRHGSLDRLLRHVHSSQHDDDDDDAAHTDGRSGQ